MGVHLCGRCLQPRQNAESGLYASSFSISRGEKCVQTPKTGVWIAEFLQKRSDLNPNNPAQAVGRGTSSRHYSRPRNNRHGGVKLRFCPHRIDWYRFTSRKDAVEGASELLL